MAKRLLDIVLSVVGLILASPVLLPVMFLIWKQDGYSPFYIAPRVGKNEKLFKMVKLRSMIKGADKSGVDSTSGSDSRITPVGHFVRRFKLDELTQLWNVLIGDMALVGPRPNVKRETDLYTTEEKALLTVRPGITDFASIVFADEGDILKDKQDPDVAYNQLIRPWKSRLGIFYVNRASLSVDVRLIVLTVVAIISRERALLAVAKMLEKLGAPAPVCEIARRRSELEPTPPPGASEIVMSRELKSQFNG